MKMAEKENIAGTVSRYLATLGIFEPTFVEFDKAWHELHKTRGIPYPDLSLRTAKEIYKLSDIVALGIIR